MPITVRVLAARHPWPASVRDISRKGIGLVTGRQFSAGTLLTVKLYHDEATVLLTTQVRVVSARADAAGWVVGCQFLQLLNESDLERLTQ